MPPLTVEYVKHATGEFDEESVFQAILPNRSLAAKRDVSAGCNLRWLDLSKNQIVRMENLDGLSQLVSVDLSFNKILKVQDLSGAPKLERLMLKANPISKIQDLEGLKASRSLRHLSFQNVDNSDACPVCTQPEYAKSLRSLCPELLALDSKRLRLPDLDREIRRLDDQNTVDIPEPQPWFSSEDLDLGEMQTVEVIEEALKDRIKEFEAAMADCKHVFKEERLCLSLCHHVGSSMTDQNECCGRMPLCSVLSCCGLS
ncbi:Lrrc61 [Symbiodinium pilosum]|uniref:Lrrc61 protein n=1 Tax=Symbiodinium pilosum TaxID=2952 RepID=A0A812Q1V5_SYMPI|nr:Lrrc61 [Symbiodinium pilosum]